MNFRTYDDVVEKIAELRDEIEWGKNQGFSTCDEEADLLGLEEGLEEISGGCYLIPSEDFRQYCVEQISIDNGGIDEHLLDADACEEMYGQGFWEVEINGEEYYTCG